MGAYLSAPVTDKDTSEGENEQFQYGVCAMQGWRTEMEDAHATVLQLDPEGTTAMFGVFDGHGGKQVAKYTAQHLASALMETEAWRSGDRARALEQAFLELDRRMALPENRAELAEMAGAQEEEDSQNRADVVLPAVLRDALEAARARVSKRAAARQRRAKARGATGERDGGDPEVEGEGDPEAEEDDEDEDFEFEHSDLIEMLEAASDDSDDEGSSGSEDAEHPPDIEAALAAKDALEGGSGPSDKVAADDRSGVDEREAGGGDEDAGDKASAGGGAGDGAAEEAGRLRNGAKRKRSARAVPTQKPEQRATNGDSREHALDKEDSSDEEEEEPLARTPAESAKYIGPSAGCTAVVALVSGDELLVANAGDSRCVCSRRGAAVAMTTDHKPTDTAENERIRKAGGYVAEGRVNGSLNLSRALGDMEYKQSAALGPEAQIVTAVPEIRRLALEPGDEFLLLACDGIWDVLSNQQAVDFVRERLARGDHPRSACEDLCNRCLAPDTEGSEGKGCDNMSAMVVTLRAFSPFADAGPGRPDVDLAALPPKPADAAAAVIGVPPEAGAPGPSAD
ncbi:hypothetical protein WJX81_000782 [Elliptochloris bilobata]|uniref:protein-serine/threonine phosphatase n=1 Tax=Elliptochloris bilobata TaxID=381761 RepID=A0AAW1SDI5_9CHLO